MSLTSGGWTCGFFSARADVPVVDVGFAEELDAAGPDGEDAGRLVTAGPLDDDDG